MLWFMAAAGSFSAEPHTRAGMPATVTCGGTS